MPIKILSTPEFNKPATFTEELKGIPVAGARGAESLLNSLGYLFGEPSMPGYQPSPDLSTPASTDVLSSLIQKQLSVPEQALQPENLLTSLGQRFAGSFIPNAILSTATGGLSTLPELAKTIGLGSAAATGAKAFGLPEQVQDVTQLATEIGRGIYKGRIKTPRGAQKLAYETTESLGHPLSENANNIQSKILDLENQITKFAPTESIEKEVKYQLGKLQDLIHPLNNKLNFKEAIQRRRSINDAFKNASSKAQPYLTDLKNSINDFFNSYAIEHPEFLKSLNKADQISTMVNMQSKIGEFGGKLISNFIPSLKLGDKGATTDKLIGGVVNNILGNTIGLAETTLVNIVKNPEARRYYLSAVGGALKEDPYLVIDNLMKLQNSFPQYFTPQKRTKGIKILKRGSD